MAGFRRLAVLGLVACICAARLAGSPFHPGGLTPRELAQGFRDGVILVKPKVGLSQAALTRQAVEGMSVRRKFERFGNIMVLNLKAGDSVASAVARLRASGLYQYVEPDLVRHMMVTPNDPLFSQQWGLSNNGSNGGIAGADIHAVAGWNTRSTASTIVVGMIDSGILATHDDLKANLWVNPLPGQTVSYATIGDTGNKESLTETDSTNGLNAVAHSGAPNDDVGHGTATSGVVGAVGSNGIGVTGVAWTVQIMALKFLDSTGSGSISDEIPCIEYAIDKGVQVINASFGSSGGSQAEMDAIQQAGKAGIVFVAAAGNSSENIDVSAAFPADYPLDNIIAVGSSDNRDLPSYFSNYGSGSVELFAPGENIESTYNLSPTSYAYLSGTSLATPFVTGTVALLKAQFPADTYRETINRVLNSVDAIPALAGKSQTGGRLNLATALTTAPNTPPNDTFASRTVLVGDDPYTRSNNTDSPATPEPGTPVVAGTSGGHSLWWQWTAPENASVEIDTSGTEGGTLIVGGSTYPTLLGVYTGSSLSSLQQVATSANYASEPLENSTGSVAYSEVNFHATAGTTYQILVQGQGAATGQTVLAINTDPDNDSFAGATVLTGPSPSVVDVNVNATTEAGEHAVGGHTLWYAWTAPKSGPVVASGYSYDFNPAVAVYTGSELGALTSIASAASTGDTGTTTDVFQCECSFTAVAGTTYYIQVDGVQSYDVGQFTLSLADARWEVATQDAVTCSPAVGADGTVYVGSNDNSFYAIGQDGLIKWSHVAGNLFDTSAAAIGADGTVYAGCSDGNIYAFGANGAVNWTYTVPNPPASSGLDNGLSSSPALAADGTIYIHADDGNLYALTSGGTLKWKEAVPGLSYAAPTIAPNGTIYIPTDGGTLYAFNPDGSTKWTYTTPVASEQIYTAVAIDASGNLYFGTLSGNFYSLDSTSKLRWVYPVGDGITSAPALANGTVYFGGYDGNLYAVGTAQGNLVWKYPLGAQVRASGPAIDANGTVYVGCYDGKIYAVGSSGTLVRTIAADDSIRSSPVIAGTTLYFGSNDHKVYAVDVGAGAAASDWPMYQFNPQRVGRDVAESFAITAQPATQTLALGSALTLFVGATGPGAVTYQWYLNGQAIAGAVNSTYSVAAVSASDAGTYTVVVTSGTLTLTSTAAVVTVGSPPPANGGGSLENLSARASVGTGSNVLIAGFVVSGAGTKNVLVRGIGPTLASSYNVPGALASAQVQLFDSAQVLISTDTGWSTTPVAGSSSVPVTVREATAADMNAVGAFPLNPGSADSALYATVPAQLFTAQVSGVAGATGVGLAEIYDEDVGTPTAQLTNLSARASVGTGGNILIAGFVVKPGQSVQLLLRGVGPTLAQAPYNVSGALAQTSVALYDGQQTLIATNTGWSHGTVAGTSSVQAIVRAATASDMSAVGAFSLAAGSQDSAMVAILPPGAYTLELSGNGMSGVGLVEVYLMP